MWYCCWIVEYHSWCLLVLWWVDRWLYRPAVQSITHFPSKSVFRAVHFLRPTIHGSSVRHHSTMMCWLPTLLFWPSTSSIRVPDRGSSASRLTVLMQLQGMGSLWSLSLLQQPFVQDSSYHLECLRPLVAQEITREWIQREFFRLDTSLVIQFYHNTLMN